MSDISYKLLIERYADGRRICNCGSAYKDGSGACRYGCSANQISAKHYIADRAAREIGVQGLPPIRFRQHRGGLDESMRTAVNVSSRQDILDQFEPWMLGVPAGEKADQSKLCFHYSGYDDRNGWDTYLVTYEGLGVLGQANGTLDDGGVTA